MKQREKEEKKEKESKQKKKKKTERNTFLGQTRDFSTGPCVKGSGPTRGRRRHNGKDREVVKKEENPR